VLLLSKGASVVVAIVGATVAGAERCWCCCYPRELACYIPANQQSGDLWTGFKGSPSLSLSVSLSFAFEVVKKKKNKTKTLQRSIGQGCSVLLAITASYSVAGPAPRVGMLLAIAAAASYNPLPASPQKRATTLCRPRHSSEL